MWCLTQFICQTPVIRIYPTGKKSFQKYLKNIALKHSLTIYKVSNWLKGLTPIDDLVKVSDWHKYLTPKDDFRNGPWLWPVRHRTNLPDSGQLDTWWWAICFRGFMLESYQWWTISIPKHNSPSCDFNAMVRQISCGIQYGPFYLKLNKLIITIRQSIIVLCLYIMIYSSTPKAMWKFITPKQNSVSFCFIGNVGHSNTALL